MAEKKDKGLDLTGEIYVGDFTEIAAQKFKSSVLAHAKDSPEEPIVVYINSYGGFVDALASMIETLDSVPNPIITVCQGVAMSCGAILLSHGDVRYCGRHSRIMIHEVSSGTGGNVHDMYADAVEIKRLNSYWMDLLAKNCNIQGGYSSLRKIIKSKDGRDLYLDAAAAVKFGICDHVGLPQMISAVVTQAITVPIKRKAKKAIKHKRA